MKKSGMLAAIGAYALWGILPVYWKSLQNVPAREILGHRVVWTLVSIVIMLALSKRWQWLKRVKEQPKILLTFLGAAALLGTNWFIYIWGVNAGHVLDTSLGYFINPLLSVLLGVLFLRERLRPAQWVAIGLAFGGVLFMTLMYGVFPWIALTLACTFGLYGLLRKTAPLGAIEGLALEIAIMSVPTFSYLVYLEAAGEASFGHAGLRTSLLLAFSGVVTAVPLLMFNYAARRITLSNIGILQYIAPTLQFLLGVLAYGEPFSGTRLIGFGTVWTALLIYFLEGALVKQKRKLGQVST